MKLELKTDCSFPYIFDKNISGPLKIGQMYGDHDGFFWNIKWMPDKDELRTREIDKEISNVCKFFYNSPEFDGFEELKTFCSENYLANYKYPGEYHFYIGGDACNYWLELYLSQSDCFAYIRTYLKAPQNQNTEGGQTNGN